VKKNIFFLKKKILKLNKLIKIFGLLITSTIIVQFAGWALDWKFGELFFPLSNESIIYSDLFSPGLDAGYFEHYQYILLLWCSILSSTLIFSKRLWGAVSIPIIYFYLFLDDSLQLHDRFYQNIINNNYLGNLISVSEFIRLKDFSELIYWSSVFLLLFLISLPGIIINNKEVKRFIFKNYKLYFLMAFFGIFIDYISANLAKLITFESHIMLLSTRVFFIILEELGEISVIAFACIWLFNLNFRNNAKKVSHNQN
tara:strand:- start:979 stop:1746 length:768 start_codon:yes stop_codon:yes gene_type:complete